MQAQQANVCLTLECDTPVVWTDSKVGFLLFPLILRQLAASSRGQLGTLLMRRISPMHLPTWLLRRTSTACAPP